MLLGMVPREQTLYQYYTGSTRSHGEGRTADNVGGAGFHEPRMGDPTALRLEQRIDGFVSADSAYAGGELVTAPFELESDSISINIDTSASGDARAALLDESRGPIGGFALDDSDRSQGNDTGLTLTWRGTGDVSALKGRRVRLLIRSRNAKFYAVYAGSRAESPASPALA